MPAKRRSMADLLAQQGAIEDPLRDPRPGKEPPEPAPAPAVPMLGAAAVPEPPLAAGDGPLSVSEQSDLSTCEAALDNLRMAFWAAGKALQTVRDGKLYRDGYDKFEDYVEDRWDMSRGQAYRLINAWPLAERLSPIGNAITESQIRELLPVADHHGQDAAAIVYETVAEVDGVKVTAAVLHKVVGILPVDNFNRNEAVAQIRAYLAGEPVVREIPPPADHVAADAERLVTRLQREVRTNPGKVRQAVADLMAKLGEIGAKLDEIERETTA